MANLGNRKLLCVGNYRFTGHRLGKGNFARVEEAVHTILKTKVAIKVMNVSEIREDYVLRHLQREARLMARLRHPCIAVLYETMRVNDGFHYLVSELAGGGDLCTHIKTQRTGKLEERSAKILARQLVSAVAYMHDLGIVHRDLKMENIMMNESKTVLKIVDFGLSNTWEPGTLLQTHCGSPEYAAPELFVTGQLYGPEVDLWSVGVILYGMVMGQLPFLTTRDQKVSSQDKRKHLLAQINRGLSAAHRKALGHLSIEFRAMLARLLVSDPAKRIAVKDLVNHTWLTDKNRRRLDVSGLPCVDNYWKKLIIKEMSQMLNVEMSQIEYSVEEEPYNMIGGMYNIFAHRHMQENVVLRAKESATQHRPALQIVSKPTIIEEALMDTSATAKMRMHESWNADTKSTESRLHVIGTKGAEASYNLNRCGTKPSQQQRTSTYRRIVPPTNIKTQVIRRPKSEPTANATKPHYNTPVQHTAERMAKRKNCHTAATTTPKAGNIVVRCSKDSDGTPSPPTTRSKFTCTAGKRVIRVPDLMSTFKKHDVTSRPATCPDHKVIPSTCQSVMSKKLHDQPIARSIAGYMANNIHAQFNKQYKWIKGISAFNETTRCTSADAPYKHLCTVRR